MAPRIEYIDLTVDDPIEIDGNISDTFYDGSVKMTCNRFLAKQENSIDFDELIGNVPLVISNKLNFEFSI